MRHNSLKDTLKNLMKEAGCCFNFLTPLTPCQSKRLPCFNQYNRWCYTSYICSWTTVSIWAQYVWCNKCYCQSSCTLCKKQTFIKFGSWKPRKDNLNLFSSWLHETFILRPARSRRIGAEQIADIQFADIQFSDDVALVTDTIEGAKLLLDRLNKAALSVGLSMNPHPETRHLARHSERNFFLGEKKREEKEEIFEKLLLNFEIFFWNKDKLIEEIFEENVSIV